tara:strand:+ start:1060 stop:1698 length:639 start_codon:yes stop_codon:yes gene_type:complete
MIPVKICGIMSKKNADIAINNSAGAIGIIFYNKSPRYVPPQNNVEWIKGLSGKIKKVGVFVDEDLEIVQSIATSLELDYIQLHGSESPDYCRSLNFPIIKAVHVGNTVDNIKISDYNVHALLFDTYVSGKKGGTGLSFDWSKLLNVNTNTPIILSGGLNSSNIIDGINAVNPDAVDLNSGVEYSVGKKCSRKIEQIFDILKKTNNNSNLFDN